VDFDFELATPQDDAAIRRLLANGRMPGSLTITFEREPNYFLGCGTMGHVCQVILARHQASDEIAAIACRAVQPRFVNGQVEKIGYIGQVRIAEKYQGLWLIPRALPFFHTLHADGQTPAYLGVISDENAVARGVMVEHPRRRFPTAHEVAHIHTLGIILQRPRPLPASPYQVKRGSMETLGNIVAFLQQHGAAKQFFPAYEESDFVDGPSTRGFDVRDFIVAYQGNDIVGVTGLWDQSGYKQSVVQAYHGTLRWARPLYNLGARLLGAQPLPAPGQHINSAYASFICTAHNDPAVFRVLLAHIYNLAAERGYAHLMLGLAEQDPLLPVAKKYTHIAYHSRLYVVYWQDAADFYKRLDKRIPYIEIAAL